MNLATVYTSPPLPASYVVLQTREGLDPSGISEPKDRDAVKRRYSM
jgi:hypothetical protein